MIPLRPSDMPLDMACAASVHPDEGEQLITFHSDSGSGGPADVGRAAHDIMKHLIRHEEYNFEAICAEHRVKPKEVGFLSYAAMRFVEMVEADFDVEEWMAEGHLETDSPFPFKGTPDIVGIMKDKSSAIIPDLKTGRVASDYEHQMRSYAHLVFSTMPEVQSVIALIFWARDLELQKWAWTRKDNETWLADVKKTIFEWAGRYTVGSHCGFCRRSVHCTARAKAMGVGRDLILRKETANALVGNDLKTAWTMVDMIIRTAEDWKSRTKERIIASGPISMGDGKELAVVERNTRATIYTVQSAAVLKKDYGFSDEDVLACCSLSKTALSDMVGERAGKGQKGVQRKAVVESLKDAGALVPKVGMVTVVRKVEEKNG